MGSTRATRASTSASPGRAPATRRAAMRAAIHVRRSPSRLRALALPFVLEHGGAALDLAQAVAVPHELRPNPELGLDAERRLEQQCRLGGDPFLPTEDAADLRHRDPHALRERGLRETPGLDELFPQDLAWTLGRLRRRNANGENHAAGVFGKPIGGT